MSERIPAAVLGATGMVGQYFISLLANHPWFCLESVVASDRSAGRRYQDACRWLLGSEMPEQARDLTVSPLGAPLDARLVFSALPSDVAGETEIEYARRGHLVFSNAGSHRMDPLVPLMVPEVNAEHAALLRDQRRVKGWSGYIVTNPNCSAAVLVTALAPLHQAFGVRKVAVTTLQALSGAGYPGVSSLDILDNAIPYIGGEEAKLESEPLKMLGRYRDGAIEPAEFVLSAHCNRIATRDGHLECVSLTLEGAPSLEAITEILRSFRALPQELALPTAPMHPIIVREEQDRPQTRLDRDQGNGMAVSVGRIRPCPILGIKFVALGSNTMRGAAGGSMLNAELLKVRGLLT
ncbi:MAG TPA: aspartate-semialdehyde dehydrogenase [Chloroflexota bacterium]|nr:aspartate-semialdehyde dehydrogenase [Chloroflexota bacterium]